jgi:regulatory protein
VALALINSMANELRQQAIRLLARREHTRAELARKLAVHGTQEEIDAVLTELQACHLQSDSRFAESYVRSHAARLGASRLRQTLKTKGVTGELIEAQLAPGVLPDELERARAVWSRKFSAAPADVREWARQARFLQGRGFASDIIGRLLRQPTEASDE